jgi:hypothetical protein
VRAEYLREEWVGAHLGGAGEGRRVDVEAVGEALEGAHGKRGKFFGLRCE